PLGIHREARRHRDRSHRAAAHVLDVLRPSVHSAAAACVRRAARPQARRAPSDGLARQHGLDGRPVRRGTAHADPGDADDAARRARRRARRRRLPAGRRVRFRGSARGARRRECVAGPAWHVARPGAVRREGTRARGALRRELRHALPGCRRVRSSGGPEHLTVPAPWRVAILTVLPRIAQGYAELVRALGHEPVCVITPRRGKPGGAPMPFAAEHVADDLESMDVLFPAAKHSLPRLLRAYDLDLALCTGYPWLITQEAIDVPRLGIVNGHPSLLPRYRGPYPIAWAIRNGETEIGLSYHFMDASFDTGNLLAQARVPVADDETGETLFEKFPAIAAGLLGTVFERLAAGDRGDPQEGGEYQSAFEEEYRHVDPAATAAEVHRQVRAWSFMPPIADRGPVVERDGGAIRIVRSSLCEVEGAERLDCADGPLWIVESEPAS